MLQFKEVSTAAKAILALFILSVLLGTGFLIFGGGLAWLHSVMMPTRSATQESVTDVVKRSSDAVVLIVISDSAGQENTLGSGFLISADGEIVTNYHVTKEAHSAIVKLSNGAFFPVKGVLASDADKDLAIIKVNGKNLPFLQLGDIDNLRVGDHVVAIGSPLGLEGTVSDGIVSAFRDAAKMKWIQTTAPVSHGNSGGPLLDMSNHVVGVITWGVDLGQNLNFAAPCSEVKALLANANQQAKPLESIASENEPPESVESENEGAVTGGKVWTSPVSGNDWNVRQDGDYLYIYWANSPFKEAGGYVRDELKKSPDGKWRGKSRFRLPCSYQSGMNQRTITWCSGENYEEIDLLSDERIEGVSGHWEKLNCLTCEPEGTEAQRPFTWIPK